MKINIDKLKKPVVQVNQLHGFKRNLDLNILKLLHIPIALLVLTVMNACAQKTTPGSLKTLQTKAGTVNIQRLASFNEPWGMTFLPDGGLLFTEKPGKLLIYKDGNISQPVTGVPTVAYGGQGGLMDVEIDPGFSQNSLVYLYYVEAGEGGQRGGAVIRAKLEGNALLEIKTLWKQNPKTSGSGHFGGRLAFAPDGKLFITSGERQKFQPAQDTAVNLGKIIRINSDGSIPADNPFVNKPGGRPETWSMGHRNPLGAAINPATQQLWINEMGPQGGDEINVPEAGKNYGWPVVSNGDNYDGSTIPDHPTRPEFEAPVHYWNPSISPSGMIFYTGTLFTRWKGNAFLGGLSGKTLVRLVTSGNKVVEEERIALNKRVRDVIQAPDGSIWVMTDDGELLRLSPVREWGVGSGEWE